jgi:hemerythrin-like domain-containing protein
MYVGMKTITQVLVMEHELFSKVFEQMERALTGTPSASEVKLLATVVEGLLEGHAKTETELAYLALDHALADRCELNRLHQDHHEIDDQFKRLQRATEAAEVLRLFKKTLAATREHFQHEEKVVFPLLEKTLQPATQWALGAQSLGRSAPPAAP